MSFIPFLMGAAEGGAAGGASTTGGFMSSIVMMVLLVVIFYFFLIRPQSKKQKETQKMLDALKKGDKVVTIGGIHGVVSSVDEKNVIVKVDDATKIKFTRSAVAAIENPEAPAKDEKKSSDADAEKSSEKSSEEKK